MTYCLQSCIALLLYNSIVSQIGIHANVAEQHQLYAQNNHLSCLDTPQDPLHASLSFSGHFMAELKCLDPNKDLPLDAPGDDGNLVCKSNANNFAEFDFQEIPECLQRRPSTKVSLTLTLFVDHKCCKTNLFLTEHEKWGKITQCMDDIIKDQKSSFGTDICQIRDCQYGHFYNISYTALKCLEIERSYSVDANFDPLRILLTVQTAAGKEMSVYNAMQEEARAWIAGAVEKDGVLHVDLGEWEAVCETSVSVGTRIRFNDGVASCRGCRATYYKMKGERRCLKCPFGQTTLEPFENECHRCPVIPYRPSVCGDMCRKIPEEKMKELCFGGRD